jgi:hypothetical protein
LELRNIRDCVKQAVRLAEEKECMFTMEMSTNQETSTFLTDVLSLWIQGNYLVASRYLQPKP